MHTSSEILKVLRSSPINTEVTASFDHGSLVDQLWEEHGFYPVDEMHLVAFSPGSPIKFELIVIEGFNFRYSKGFEPDLNVRISTTIQQACLEKHAEILHLVIDN